uniref:SCP domain-containing protein n=1 Tax=Panagrolaimus superbus TaxID=310955 RepID=A0A914YKF6_9BILA
MLKFLVILIFSFFISSSFAGICPGTDLTDELRKTIVDVHNQLRSELAQGKSIMKNNKTAPPAKNMYKMRYDCCLEASAQSVVETCEMKHSKHECRNSGENLWAKGSSKGDPKNDIPGALKGWWSELANRGETVPIYQDGIGHWAAVSDYFLKEGRLFDTIS